jgi:hypothetical protein
MQKIPYIGYVTRVFSTVFLGNLKMSFMKFFYLSSKPNDLGHFEIHEKECPHIPEAIDRDYLGPFNNGQEALRKALLMNPGSVCCEHCCQTNFEARFSQSKKNQG